MWYIFKYLKCLLNLRLSPRRLQPHHPLIGEITDVVNFNDLKDKKIMLINRETGARIQHQRSSGTVPVINW